MTTALQKSSTKYEPSKKKLEKHQEGGRATALLRPSAKVLRAAKSRRLVEEGEDLWAMIPVGAAVADPRAAFPTGAAVEGVQAQAVVVEGPLGHPIGSGHSCPW